MKKLFLALLLTFGLSASSQQFLSKESLLIPVSDTTQRFHMTHDLQIDMFLPDSVVFTGPIKSFTVKLLKEVPNPNDNLVNYVGLVNGNKVSVVIASKGKHIVGIGIGDEESIIIFVLIARKDQEL